MDKKERYARAFRICKAQRKKTKMTKAAYERCVLKLKRHKSRRT